MRRRGNRSHALALVGDRFVRQQSGGYLDLATGQSVELCSHARPPSAAASVTRDAALPSSRSGRDPVPAVAAAERLADRGGPAARRAARAPRSEAGWCATSSGLATIRGLGEALDAVEPSRPRVIRVGAPAGAVRTLIERAATEAGARGFVPLSPEVAAAEASIVNAVRGRSVILLISSGATTPSDEGRQALGSVLVALSSARVAAVVRISAAASGTVAPADTVRTSAGIDDGPAHVVSTSPRAAVAGLLARRRFAHCERVLRRRAFLERARHEGAAGAAAALYLAERQRQRGDVRAALTTVAHARQVLASRPSAPMAYDVAAAHGCLETDLAHLARARDLLEGTWAASVATAGRGHPRCGVMLARCCAWQGQPIRAAEVLGAVTLDAATDDVTAATWWALRVRLLLAQGEVGVALRALREAQVTRRWTDSLAIASLAVEAIDVHAALGNREGAARATREAAEAAARAGSLLAAAEVRLALLRTRRQLGEPHARSAKAASWLHRRRSRLPPLVREQVAHALRAAGSASGCRTPSVGRRPFGQACRQRGSSEGRRFEMIDEVVDVLRICHDTDDERDTLGRICVLLRTQLGAVAVGVDADDGTPLARAAGAGRVTFSLAERAARTGASIPLTEVDASLEAAVAVRYGGAAIAALCARWCGSDRPDADRTIALLKTAAAVVAPAVRTLLDRRALPSSAPADDLGIVGLSRAVEDVRQRVRQAAHVPFPVLIEGESGSGKELVARALHRAGARRPRRFCAINCAALTDELFEAELFGHARGAFTGAIGERAGVFEEADGGTLFLDEVTELSPRAQAKLLRVLQEGEVRRVGETFARRVDVRIVSATNRSLSHEVRHGRFRDDLRYRLDVVRLVVPPLRERREDIGLLAAHFWHDATTRTGSRATLDPQTVATLARHDWPGNVRELQNAMALLAVSAPRRGRVLPTMLPVSVRPGEPGDACRPARLDSARRSFERAFVRDALLRNGGRRTTTALELGLTRQGLSKLLARLGLDELPDESSRTSTA